MTKSTITRERIQQIFLGNGPELSASEERELARMTLVAMDSEPVAYIFKHPAGRLFWSLTDESNKGHDDVMPVYASPQPAPEEWTIADAVKFCKETGRQDAGAAMDAWNACRAAMLQAGNSPAQSDCCPAQNVVAPAQSPIDHGYLPECECSGCKATARICTEMAVNSLVIPNEMTSEQAYEIGYYYGDPVDVFARGDNWMRQHIIDSTLAAAQQSPGSEPATLPGKWIPVSERMPDCWCLTCRPVVLNDMRFVVCPDCGNKRCPRANDHRNACTGSNEPGQEGGAYPDTPQEVKP